MLLVPVVSSTGKPLMPCRPERARELVRKGRALRRFKKGFFYIRLLDRADGDIQPVACGIDPGSKKEGFTVKSEKHTFINIQVDAVTWVKKSMETRSNLRKARRGRKTPYRACRLNRAVLRKEGLPPSTKARWDLKLRISKTLSFLYPIYCFVVEDIQAVTKPGKRKWNASFSPLEVGKKYFYREIAKVVSVPNDNPVVVVQGWETSIAREEFGQSKTKDKMSEVFEAHCVDSWAMATVLVGGEEPDNKKLVCLTPLQFHRRQLQVMVPSKGGERKQYGSTRSMGFKRGSIVKHPKYGTVLMGGTSDRRVSLHSLRKNERLCRNGKSGEISFVTWGSWIVRQ